MRVKTTSSYVSYISITTSRCSPSCPQIVKDCPKRKNPTEKKKKRTLRLFHAFKARLKHNAGKLQNVELSYNFSKACRGISRLSPRDERYRIPFPETRYPTQRNDSKRFTVPRAFFPPRCIGRGRALQRSEPPCFKSGGTERARDKRVALRGHG